MRYAEGAWVRPFGTAEGAGFGWEEGTVLGGSPRKRPMGRLCPLSRAPVASPLDEWVEVTQPSRPAISGFGEGGFDLLEDVR